MRLPGRVAACLLVVSTSVFSVSSALARKWECGERSNLPIEGKNYCAAGDFRQTEINLSKLIEDLQKSTGAQSDQFLQDQMKFEVNRDNQCDEESTGAADKPYHPMLVSQCKTRLTNRRIEELKRHSAGN